MANKRRKIIDWNHVSKDLSIEELKTLEELYKYYHRKYWLFNKLYSHYKTLDLGSSISSPVLVVTGTIVGGVTLNPVLQTFLEAKNLKRKVEMCRFASTSYEKILLELRSYTRGPERVTD